MCGGFTDKRCGRDEYCEYERGMCVTEPHGPGTCRLTPRGCETIVRPVCGCDGKSYPNRCEAAAAGMSIAAEGLCRR